MKLQLGTWMSIGSPIIAELAAQCGFDWLLLDLEHGCGTAAAGDYAHCLRHVVAAAQESGKQTGILIRDLADLMHHGDLGFTHIAVDSDLAILRKSYLHTVSNTKQAS